MIQTTSQVHLMCEAHPFGSRTCPRQILSLWLSLHCDCRSGIIELG